MMTDEQAAKFRASSYCTFPVASYPKRFVRNLDGYEGELTPAQANYLNRLVYHYRKQVVPQACKWSIADTATVARWIADGEAAVKARKAESQP
jgi:hypothetical protein